MKALVTGSAGFIGKHLCPRLEADGWDVEGMDVVPSKYGSGDAVFQEVYDFQPDVVFHLACQRMNDSEYNIHGAYNSNLMTVVNMVAEYPDATHVLASTSSMYKDGRKLTEKAELHAKTIYALSKLAAEKFLKHQVKDYRILRFGNVYGPGHDPEHPSPDVISTFVRNAAQNKPLMVFDPEAVRDFVHVSDIVDGLIMSLDGEPGVYNLGGRTVGIHTLARCIIAGTADCKSAIITGSPRPIDTVKIKSLDSSKAEKTFGWKAKKDIAEGLFELITEERTKCLAK